MGGDLSGYGGYERIFCWVVKERIIISDLATS